MNDRPSVRVITIDLLREVAREIFNRPAHTCAVYRFTGKRLVCVVCGAEHLRSDGEPR